MTTSATPATTSAPSWASCKVMLSKEHLNRNPTPPTLDQIVNIDALSAGPATQPPVAPPEWTMDVEYTNGGYEGVVKRTDRVMCRIMLGGRFDHLPVARTALAPKARAWIAEFLQRRPG